MQKIELPNGLRLLVKEDHRLPFVEMRAVFQGGVLAESAENNGLTQLVVQNADARHASAQRGEDCAGDRVVGGSIDTFGGNNSFGVSAEVLSSDLSRL